jgi:Domain of unknown function (DUF4249)
LIFKNMTKNQLKVILKDLTMSFLFFYLLISCHTSNPLEIRPEQLVVFSVLQPNQYPQTVIVDRTYGLIDTITDTTGISGATVMIWNESLSDTIRFIESDTHGFYHDNIGSRWVKPFETYYLNIIYDGDTVIASTLVPDTFRFLSPYDGETLHTSSLPVFSWTKSEGAKAYFVLPFKSDTARATIPLVVYDTLVDVNPYKEAYFDSTGFYRIKNYVFDDNRYRYEVGTKIDTLGDGIGLFGSQSFSMVTVFIIKD